MQHFFLCCRRCATKFYKIALWRMDLRHFFFFLCNSIDWPIKMQSYLEVCNVILIKNNKKQLCCKEKVADITIDMHCIRMRKSRRGPKFQECGNLQMKGINIYFIRSLFVFDSLSNKSEFKYAHSLMTNRMRNC